MNSPQTESRLGLTLAAWFLAVVGWAGVIVATNFLIPTVGPRWLFFMVWFVALTGSAVPFANFLHRRFSGHYPSEGVALREAIWVGLFGATCAWLQLGRALNWATGLLLAAALIAIEAFLILRVRSQWKPNDTTTTPERRDTPPSVE